ncbi:MAG: DUF308 domain-containing protein [Synechococcaceae cyanobacterium ELA263]
MNSLTPLQRAEDSLRGLTLAEGILMVVLGVLALIFPLLASVWVTAVVAIAFLVGGLVGWINTLTRAARLQRLVTFGRLVVASLFLVAGLWMVNQLAAGPLTAAIQVAGLALALAVVFLLEGLMATVVALSHRQVRGWGWGLANGLVTMILGLLILTIKPVNLLSVLGLLVGISFIFSGIDLLSFSASFHSQRQRGRNQF